MQVEVARFNMIEQQIRPWEVVDERVLDTLSTIKREEFVPEQYRNLAFADIEVPLGDNQYMMFPRIEARMLQALAIQPHERVLEIGTGSGFMAACMASLGGYLTSIDLNGDFTQSAQEKLDRMNISNAQLVTGDGLAERVGAHRYDVIAITGSVTKVPEILKEQLTEHGRIFAITGTAPVMQAILITRSGDAFDTQVLFETEHVSLQMTEKTQEFIF